MIYDEPFISGEMKKTGLDILLKEIINPFSDELNKINRDFYNYESNPGGDVFTIIERTWLGIFNNALIKFYGDDITTLQEFTIWDNNRATGRLDFLLRWNETNILIEGKNYEYKKNAWEKWDDEVFYDVIAEKVNKKYFGPEKDLYSGKTFGMILCFDWIRKGNLNEAIHSFESLKMENGKTDFCVLFKNNIQGVLVYGHVFKLNDN